MLGFFSSRLNWDSPTPTPADECVPLWFGGGDTLARGRGGPSWNEGTDTMVSGAHSCGRGGGRVPIRTRRQTLWYSRYICTLWAEIKAIYSWCYLGSILPVTYFMLERVGRKGANRVGRRRGERGKDVWNQCCLWSKLIEFLSKLYYYLAKKGEEGWRIEHWTDTRLENSIWMLSHYTTSKIGFLPSTHQEVGGRWCNQGWSSQRSSPREYKLFVVHL